jgi:hypothetical protein
VIRRILVLKTFNSSDLVVQRTKAEVRMRVSEKELAGTTYRLKL